MEEEKAAAYYDELTRKGEGAARFKRGLGFSSNDEQNEAVPQRGSAFVSSSSSFLSGFVRASSPTTASKLEKESQLQSIQNKLKKKPEREARVSEKGSVEMERDRDRDKDRHSRRRSKSRSRDRYRENERRRRRSRSRSPRRDRRKSRSRSPRRDRRRSRSRSRSPRRDRKSERRRSGSLPPRESRRSERDGGREGKSKKEKNGAVDYSRLIEGYDRMARREEQIKTAHDEAIFGTSTVCLPVTADSEPDEENLKKDSNDNGLATSLLSEKVLAKQPGSWRDRVRKA
ncbi:splicing regulatory glutamine/lysine-rich protein 1-like isoform X4 [Durio zibethinus]|uniref:Splicing regulatory glutamine/lysine-rich protein 1-like isoform X4 n=1 Tax=Durio zibethinus TaxID=66656 RepID=A0A6P6ASN0_DURZI|nr:splicing regulatory glutamine/lysine-rich protein 1-like isoform X4 [Durio zibethinus]